MLAEQTAWLEKVLADNPNRWTIVEFHQPIFSPAKGRDNPEQRAAWKPLFDRHGVDLVLTGHDHTCWEVRYPHSRVRGIDALPTGSGRSVYIESKVLLFDVYICLFGLR